MKAGHEAVHRLELVAGIDKDWPSVAGSERRRAQSMRTRGPESWSCRRPRRAIRHPRRTRRRPPPKSSSARVDHMVFNRSTRTGLNVPYPTKGDRFRRRRADRATVASSKCKPAVGAATEPGAWQRSSDSVRDPPACRAGRWAAAAARGPAHQQRRRSTPRRSRQPDRGGRRTCAPDLGVETDARRGATHPRTLRVPALSFWPDARAPTTPDSRSSRKHHAATTRISPADQPCGKDPGVVGHDHIARRDQRGQIMECAFLKCPGTAVDDEQPRCAARPGFLRDQFGGQFKIEVDDAHGPT